jgi:beta-glucosidase
VHCCLGGCTAVYSEGLLVGYRWYSAHPEVSPAYEFGYGLTYADSFDYSNLTLSPDSQTVSCTVTNNGTRGYAGRETAQLYLRFPQSAGEPPQQLKAWHKLPLLAAGASATAQFHLEERSFSIWDTKTHMWKVVRGEFGVLVGASSVDIRLVGTLSSDDWV